MDTKKKELVGAFKQGGREWRPQGRPEAVRVPDCLQQAEGRATPYGIYDLGRNAGWVNVGIDHDTATFAVESIRRWWEQAGQARYPHTHPRRQDQEAAAPPPPVPDAPPPASRTDPSPPPAAAPRSTTVGKPWAKGKDYWRRSSVYHARSA